MSKLTDEAATGAAEKKSRPGPIVQGIEFAQPDGSQIDVETRKIIDKQEKIAVQFPVRGKKIRPEELAKMKLRRINPEAQYVTIIVNGVIGRFERGVPLHIPRAFYEAWQNSDQT